MVSIRETRETLKSVREKEMENNEDLEIRLGRILTEDSVFDYNRQQ